LERVKAADYGIEIVFGGSLSREEAEDVLAELQRKLPPAGGRFGLLVDSRGARAYYAAAQEVFKRAIFLCLERGMDRSVVVHDSPIASLQARRLAIETGTLLWTRYIDADSRSDWRQAARDWLIEAIDPDLA
jgi:D-serine deaminase-like pyridoxal phosphate-dependent protein